MAKTYPVGCSDSDYGVQDFVDEIPAITADHERSAPCGRLDGAQNGLDEVLGVVRHLKRPNRLAQTTGSGFLVWVRHRRDKDRVHCATVTHAGEMAMPNGDTGWTHVICKDTGQNVSQQQDGIQAQSENKYCAGVARATKKHVVLSPIFFYICGARGVNPKDCQQSRMRWDVPFSRLK